MFRAEPGCGGAGAACPQPAGLRLTSQIAFMPLTEIKPHCIVYISQLRQPDKEDFQ
jgi:hypothetical protein